MVSGGSAGQEQTVKVEIALMEVVGNEWQEDDIAILQEGLRGGSGRNLQRNRDRHRGKYRVQTSAAGVKIRRKAQGFARETEQSLVLAYENLEPGHQALGHEDIGAQRQLHQVHQAAHVRPR